MTYWSSGALLMKLITMYDEEVFKPELMWRVIDHMLLSTRWGCLLTNERQENLGIPQ